MPDGTLLGYADRLSARPGEHLDVFVSCGEEAVDVDVVRLLCGDEHPDGPGARSEEVAVPGAGTFPTAVQPVAQGSFAIGDPVDAGAEFALEVWAWATTPDLRRRQALVARPGHFAVVLDPEGALVLEMGGTRGPAVAIPARRWTRIVAAYDGESATLSIDATGWPPTSATATARMPAPAVDRDAPLLFAAGGLDPAFGHPAGTELFNGKLEEPCLRDGTGRLIRRWSLGAGADVTFAGLPDTPATGHRHDGSHHHPALAPEHYGACLFHDDDVEDCRWERTTTLTLPADLPSGVYGARLRAAGMEDLVPFFVLPPAGRATSDVAILFPTASYAAYANERLQESEVFQEPDVIGRPIEPDRGDAVLRAHRDLGSSLYDTHVDGSGIAFSSMRRPVVNMRPWHRNWLTGAPRAFSADLYLVDWLDRTGVAADALTDHDLHAEGAALLAPYRVLITGCHPEYWTAAMLDALRGWLDAGGRLMYLGGNGFYWVTSIAPDRPHLVEIRRGVCGIRAWESAPGEMHHTTTGELGGLWRNRGRSPNALVGVGFAAQGFDDAAPGYHQLPDARDPAVAFALEGIAPDEVIGDFGHSMGGAASDELDRHDVRHGSPPDAFVLATSQGGHSDHVLLVCEDVPVTHLKLGGTTCDDVRSDVTLMPTAHGGAVFSVGSIGWTAAMAHSDYDNNVARLTGNVLRRFRDPAPLDLVRGATPR